MVADVENLPEERVRGQTARTLIEMCICSVESDASVNLAYLLCGFDITDLQNTEIEGAGGSLKGMNLERW